MTNGEALLQQEITGPLERAKGRFTFKLQHTPS